MPATLGLLVVPDVSWSFCSFSKDAQDSILPRTLFLHYCYFFLCFFIKNKLINKYGLDNLIMMNAGVPHILRTSTQPETKDTSEAFTATLKFIIRVNLRSDFLELYEPELSVSNFRFESSNCLH